MTIIIVLSLSSSKLKFSSCHYSFRTDEQLRVDRRRLEAAHLKYATLKVMKWYPETFKTYRICVKQENTLEKITGYFYSAFTSRYAGTYINGKVNMS